MRQILAEQQALVGERGTVAVVIELQLQCAGAGASIISASRKASAQPAGV